MESFSLMLPVPGTREPGELPSMGSHRVGHDWSDLAAAAAAAAEYGKFLQFAYWGFFGFVFILTKKSFY